MNSNESNAPVATHSTASNPFAMSTSAPLFTSPSSSSSSSATKERFVAKGRPRVLALQADHRRSLALQKQRTNRELNQATLRETLALEFNNAPVSASSSGATAAQAGATVESDSAATATTAVSSSSQTAKPRSEASWHRTLRMNYASRLMQPSFMDELPSDALAQWYVRSRPEGARCLVIARGGATISRNKNGTILHSQFPSMLPHGSKVTHSHQHASPSIGGESAPATICDCIWNETARCYFIMDVQLYNGYQLVDASAEFRFYWIRDKLNEILQSKLTQSSPSLSQSQLISLPVSANNQYPFYFLPFAPCAYESWNAVYPHDPILRQLQVQQDGYLLMHKETHYEFGSTELCLQWKDEHCSRYMVDTIGNTETETKQTVTLRYCESRRLECAEGELVGFLDEFTYQTVPLHLGDLLVFHIDGIEELETPAVQGSKMNVQHSGRSSEESKDTTEESSMSDVDTDSITFNEAPPVPILKLLNLTFAKAASRSRVLADTLSRIRFQYHARTGQLLSAPQIAQELHFQQNQLQPARAQQQPTN